MRTAVGVGLCVALVLLAGGPAPGQRDKGGKDLVVAGKRVSAWVKSLEGKEALPRVQAINALIQAGPEARRAVPALIGSFRDNGATFLHPLAAVALSRIGPDAVPELQKALNDDSYAVRAGAALALGLIGPASRPAVLALAGKLKDPEALVRTAAAQALGRIGSLARAGVPALRTSLTDKDASVQVEAALALWKVANEARGASVLAKALQGEALAERSAAALGEIGPAAKAAIPALRAALKATSPRLRIAAAEALYRVSKDAEVSLPVLESLCESKEAGDRLLAISALGTLAAEPKAVALLARMLKSKEGETRREAACSLAERGAALDKAGPALEAGLRDRDHGVRWWCALALAASEAGIRKQEEGILRTFRQALFPSPDREPFKAILDVQGPASVRGPAALADVLRTRSARLRAEAARSLARFGPDARPAQAALIESFKGDKLVRRAAAEALAQMGTEALPVLTRLLGNPEARVREGAARALGEMGLPARSATSSLERLREDSDSIVRAQVVLGLWRLDQAAGEADLWRKDKKADKRAREDELRMIKRVLVDVDNKDRWEAIEAVGVLSAEARPPIKGLLEVLVNGLKDRDARVRAHAAKWIFRRTRQGKEVAPFLRDVVADRDAFVRQSAVEALGELGAEARVVPVLTVALLDKDPGVRLAAEEGLARGGAEAVPQVLDALKGRNEKVKPGLIRALGLMGPAAKSAVPTLEGLKRDKNANVRKAAEEALEAIGPVKTG
jgi:HEAT repeat protein